MADLEYDVKIDVKNALKGVNDLKKQLKASGKVAKETDKSFKAFGSSIAKLGGLLSGLSVAGLGVAVKKSLDFADAIGKAAKVADISTSSLQELRFAFDKFGVTSKETDDGLRRLSRRLGEFVKSGGGPAKIAFDQLGLSTEILSGKLKGTEPVFNKVAELFGRIEDQTVKSALAAQLFGDDAGPKLAAALAKGTLEVNNFRRQAKELGLVMDEGLIKGAESANDQLSILSQVIKTQIVTAVVKAAPQIQAFVTSIIENRAGIQETINSLVDFVKIIGKAGGAVVQFAKDTNIISSSLEEQIKKVETVIAGGFGERLRFFGEDGLVEYYSDADLQDKLNKLKAALAARDAENITSIKKTKDAAKDAAAELAKIKPFELVKTPDTKKAAADKKANDERKKAIEDLRKEAQALGAAYKPYETALANIRQTEERLTAARKAGTITLKEYKDALGGLRKEEQELNDARQGESTKFADGWSRAFTEYQTNAEDAASVAANAFTTASQGIEDSLVAVTKGSKSLLDGLKDTALDVFEDIYRAQIRATISSGGNWFAGLFAQGGYIPAGKTGIVGEAGPEFVSGPATVTSAADTAAMMSNGGSTNINIYANDALSFNDMLARDPGFVNQVVQVGQRIGGRR